MPNNRLFVVGLDAADKDLIEKWVGEGYLPAFEKLLNDSVYGDIENPRGLEAGAVWPTFYFGLIPGNMGQYDGARIFDSQIYDHQSYQPDIDASQPIWASLSKGGKRCGVIDAPYNYPVANINGMKVCDRGLHVPCGGGDFMKLRAHPPELVEEIENLFGPDLAGGRSSDFFLLDTPEQLDEFRDIYSKRIENKADLILHYWSQEPWDFFMSVFTEAHCAGHRCWHIHDPAHPQHDAEFAKKVGNPLRDIYVALDKAIGRMVESVKDDAKVVVYLSHGMGPRHSGTRVLDRLLAKMDNQAVATRSGLLMDTARRVWRLMPETLRKPFLKIRNNVTNDGFQPNRDSRRFFEVYANDRTAGIRINLEGREAKGVVRQEEFDALCEELSSEMSALINPENGKSVVREVIRTRDCYRGEFLDRLPDLLVTWNRESPINFIESEKFGVVDTKGIDMHTRTGDHRIEGRFFAIAEEWQQGKLEKKVKAEDFAPTFAELLSVKLQDTDGFPIQALVNTGYEDSTDLEIGKRMPEKKTTA